MRKLLFFSRVAFICNIFFVICFSIQLTNWIHDEQLKSTIVILGYVLGIPLNVVINLIYLVLFAGRKKFWQTVPSWLITANIIFLVIQILYFFYLNDTQHT
jgi:uncharacterized BrkB/YihY/UPF0761 family membrane protein